MVGRIADMGSHQDDDHLEGVPQFDREELEHENW